MSLTQAEIEAGLRAVANKRAEAEYSGCLRPDPSQQRRKVPVIVPVEPEQNTEPEPEQKPVDLVAIWPLLFFAADRAGLGCAWRLWSLAWQRAGELDPHNSGKISRADLVDYCGRQGVNDRTLRRWISDAEAAHFLRSVRGGSVFLLTSLERVAHLVKCGDIGLQAVNVPARGLARSGEHWKSTVWGGFLTSFVQVRIVKKETVGPDGRLQETDEEEFYWPAVSRERLEQLSGVPACTQRRLEAHLKIKTRKNYVMTGLDASHLAGYLEHTGKPAFSCRLPRRRGQRSAPVFLIAYRLPDVRKYGKHTDLKRPGRAWRVNAALVASVLSNGCEINSHSLDSQQAKSLLARGFVREQRLFFSGQKGAEAVEKAARKIGASDRRDIRELFLQLPTLARRCGWWQEVALGR